MHGHVHLNYDAKLPRVCTCGNTTVINATERYVFEIRIRIRCKSGKFRLGQRKRNNRHPGTKQNASAGVLQKRFLRVLFVLRRAVRGTRNAEKLQVQFAGDLVDDVVAVPSSGLTYTLQDCTPTLWVAR